MTVLKFKARTDFFAEPVQGALFDLDAVHDKYCRDLFGRFLDLVDEEIAEQRAAGIQPLRTGQAAYCAAWRQSWADVTEWNSRVEADRALIQRERQELDAARCKDFRQRQTELSL